MFVNCSKDQSNMPVLSLENEDLRHKYHSLGSRLSSLNLLLIVWSTFYFNACSVFLDPSVCTTNSDCNGGVCQLGVCIGDIQEQDQDINEAGASTDNGVDIGPDMSNAGEEPEDMMTAGEMQAGDILLSDMMLDEVFNCEINTTSLMNSGVTRRNTAPSIDGSTHWITNELNVLVSFNITTPNDTLWITKTKVLLGDEQIEVINQDNELQAQLELPNEGSYRLRVLVGDIDDIRCVDQLFITADRSAPELSLLTPNTPETWIGQLTDSAQTTLSVEVRDLSQVNLSVVDSNGVAVSTRAASDESLWSTAIGLGEGENRFTILASDELVQESEREITFHYDPYPPGIGLSEPASNRITVEDSRLSIAGFIYQRQSLNGNGGEGGIESDARVIVTNYVGTDNSGLEVDRVQVRTSETGAFQVNTQLALGSNYMEVCAFDRAENQTCSELYVTRVESQPCVNITSSNFTAQSNYTISGNVCPSVSSLNLSINGGQSQNLLIAPDLSFSREINLSQDGVVTPITLEAVADDGQRALAQLEVMWDSTPPIVVISSPSPSACYNQESVEVCGRVIDPESGTQSLALNRSPLDLSDQYVEGEAWWESFCTQVELQVPRDQAFNEQTITLSGINRAGLDTETAVTVTVDRIAPDLSFDSPTFEQWYRPNALGRVELRGEITYSGCSLASPGPIQLSLASGVSGTLVLEGNGRFSYRAILNDGAQQLNGTIRDRAGNERAISYDFNVDGTGPSLDLIAPSPRSVSQQANLSITIQGEDLGSGLLNTSAIVRGEFGEQVMSSVALGGSPERYELSADLSFDAGEHEISVVITDQVGNENTINLSYIRDTTAPHVYMISPSSTQLLPNLENIVLEVSDELSQVTQVSVNEISAQRFGDFWLAENVIIQNDPAEIAIDAIDEAGNRYSQEQAAPLAVNLAPLAWQDPGRLGLNSRPYQKEDLSFGDDFSIGLGTITQMLWFADFNSRSELLSFYNVAAEFIPSPLSLIANNGVNSWQFEQDVHSRIPQAILPKASELIAIQSTTIKGVLTLFTLSQESDASPIVRVWQRFGEVNVDTEVLGDPLTSPETWVEVRLGLPPSLNAHAISLGDIDGDGRYDLISIDANGVFFFRQNAEGEFDFNAAGLGLRGINTLSTEVQKLWWVDLNGDDLLDLIAQDQQGLHVWLKSLSANAYEYELIDDFPLIDSGRQIDGCLNVDWDQDGVLEAIVWSSGQGTNNSLLRRYHLDNGQWSATAIYDETLLPQTLTDLQLLDLDADRNHELLLVSPSGLSSIEVGGQVPQVTIPDLPLINELTPELQSVKLADFDADGDEDVIVNLNTSPPAGDSHQTRGESWVLNASPNLLNPDLYTLRILPKRFNADGQDAQGVIIRIASNGDLNFDEVYTAQPFHETILYSVGPATVTLQVSFPDYGTLGDHTVTEYNVEFGQQIIIVDPQE